MDNDFTFAESEARKHALDIAADFDKVDGKRRTIDKLVTVNIPLNYDTTGERKYIKIDSTPEYYIYNYKPSGFAIIAADERSLGHIASSMVATIDANIHNGYKLMLDGAIANVLDDREGFAKEMGSISRTSTYDNLVKKIQDHRTKMKEASQSPKEKIFSYIRRVLNIFSTPAFANVMPGCPKNSL